MNAENKLVRLMREGRRLMWFGHYGPELEGCPFWPPKSLVRRLLKDGVLEWGEPLNETQERCGICPLQLKEARLP